MMVQVGSVGPYHLPRGGREPGRGTFLEVQCIAQDFSSLEIFHNVESPAQAVSCTCELTQFPSQQLNTDNF